MPTEEFLAQFYAQRPLEVQQQVIEYVRRRFEEPHRPEARLFFEKALLEAFPTQEEEVTRLLFERAGPFLERVGQPPPMLVEQLIPERSLILLTGKPKHAKSFCALDIADCIASGRLVFGDFKVNRPGPVCYLGMEDGDFEIANRLLARGFRFADERPLYICTQKFKLGNEANMTVLRQALAEIEPVLIVIDTAAEALGIRKWEDRGEVTEKVAPIMRFAREICSVLMVAHNRKAEGTFGDEIAGTNAFTGAVDGWLSAQSKQTLDNGNLQIKYQKEGRGGLRGELMVEMDTVTLHFRALTDEEIEEAQKARREQQEIEERRKRMQQIAQAIRTLGGKATVRQIAQNLEWDYARVYANVKHMLGMGFLADTGERAAAEGGGRAQILYQVTELFNLEHTSIDVCPKLNTNASSAEDSDPAPPDVRRPYKEDDDAWR